MLKIVLRWFQPPVFPEDEDKTRSALLLNVVQQTFLIALPILFVGVLLGGPIPRYERILILLACAWLTVFGTRLTMLAGYVTIAGIASIISIFITTTLTVYNIGTVRAPATSFYLLIIVASGLIIGRRAIIWMTGIVSLTIILLILGEKNGYLPTPSLGVTITQGITFIVAFAVVSRLLYLAVKSVDEALAGVRRELTERKRVEAERENYIEELGKQNAELERFSYTISHDLKSPIVTIKGFLGLLQKDMQDNNRELIQKDFDRILGAAEKMETLLSELLELSRIGRIVNPPTEIDLVKLTQEALESLDARIRSSNVKVNVASDLPHVFGDHIRLREVLENLIDNAAKYMGAQPDPLIEIGTMESKTEIVIFIKDNGMGIEPRFFTRIFGLFEKLSADSEGTGIGLALIKRIIEIHGGRIWVESEGPGRGSTFSFTLPKS